MLSFYHSQITITYGRCFLILQSLSKFNSVFQNFITLTFMGRSKGKKATFMGGNILPRTAFSVCLTDLDEVILVIFIKQSNYSLLFMSLLAKS